MRERINIYEFPLPEKFIIDSVAKVISLLKATEQEVDELNDPNAVIVWVPFSYEQ